MIHYSQCTCRTTHFESRALLHLLLNVPALSTFHFVNSHFVNSHLVNVDKVGIDKVGVDLWRNFHSTILLVSSLHYCREFLCRSYIIVNRCWRSATFPSLSSALFCWTSYEGFSTSTPTPLPSSTVTSRLGTSSSHPPCMQRLQIWATVLWWSHTS